MRADPASSMSCVNCHNTVERSSTVFARRVSAGIAAGKQWKQHQLLGAIEARVPVDKIDNLAAGQAQATPGAGLTLSLLAFGAFATLALRDMRRKHRHRLLSRPRYRLDTLLANADAAMYGVKRDGRNGYRMWRKEG